MEISNRQNRKPGSRVELAKENRETQQSISRKPSTHLKFRYGAGRGRGEQNWKELDFYGLSIVSAHLRKRNYFSLFFARGRTWKEVVASPVDSKRPGAYADRGMLRARTTF